MNAVAYFAVSAEGAVTAFAIAALWLLLRPRSVAARRFVIVVALVYLAACVYAVPASVGKLLTIGYHELNRGDVPAGRVALVVLGAGDETVIGWDDHMSVPNADAAARVLEAVRVDRLIHPEWIISSGGVSDPEDLSEPSSTNMRDVLIRHGVPPTKILLNSVPGNTHGEAVAVAAMLRALGADHLVVVTSAVHMRRSLGAFRVAGVDAIPAIAPDGWFGQPWTRWIVPTSHGLAYSADVVHELFGLPYYWVRGWWRPR
jgi:uncharacterized SAM-binding protein YcdF (DUF218 family)